eukprot:1854127-Rhodomonas_salina.1
MAAASRDALRCKHERNQALDVEFMLATCATQLSQAHTTLPRPLLLPLLSPPRHHLTIPSRVPLSCSRCLQSASYPHSLASPSA